jgi:ArsR family transcriptional regulator
MVCKNALIIADDEIRLTADFLSYIFPFGNIPTSRERPMRDFIGVMKALADPNRVKMLKMLQHRVLCVCEIQAALELAQPTVSKHLQLLAEAGLVASEKDGLWVNYRLADGGKSPFAATLLGNLRHWLERDREIEQLVKRLPAIARGEICRRQPAESRAKLSSRSAMVAT